MPRAAQLQLTDGKYEDAANQYAVELSQPQASGDLNADGDSDAAVHLVVNSGGSGVFSYLSAVLNDNGAAKPLERGVSGRPHRRALHSHFE